MAKQQQYTGTLPYSGQTAAGLQDCIDWAYSRGSMEARGLAYYLSKRMVTGLSAENLAHARDNMALPSDPQERAMLAWVLATLKA